MAPKATVLPLDDPAIIKKYYENEYSTTSSRINSRVNDVINDVVNYTSIFENWYIPTSRITTVAPTSTVRLNNGEKNADPESE